MSSVLSAQGKKREALEFSERWYDEEPDNLVAAVSLIYARVGVKDLEGAESLVKQYISDDTLCNDENEILFTAAAMVYKLSGNKKEEKRMNKAIKEYEKVLEDFFMGKVNFEDDDLDFDDEELPF